MVVDFVRALRQAGSLPFIAAMGASRVLAAVATITVVICGCSQTVEPVSRPADHPTARNPVVFVPGVTGVSLVDTESGRKVWGTGHRLLSPHDRGYSVAGDLGFAKGARPIEPGSVLLEMQLFGVLRVEVYRPLVRRFVEHGYRWGDLAAPRPEDDFFLFAYDWRQDNTESAARLAGQLERLRHVRGDSQLRIDLVCQSNGAHICRYFAKYRGLSLEEAESRVTDVAARVEVRNMVLVGTSNGGSIRVLRELNRGRKYIAGIGRRFAPETLFTFDSLFQDLPIYTDDLFVNESGEPVEVDLFAADSWRKYGWSIYTPEVRSRSAGGSLPAMFGSDQERTDHLAWSLERAKRFHELLQAPGPGFGRTRTFLLLNTRNHTSSRAILRQRDGRWQTLFGDDTAIRRSPQLAAATVEDGDGHATVASQRWLSAEERQRFEELRVDVEVSHRKIILHPRTLATVLEIVSDDEVRSPR